MPRLLQRSSAVQRLPWAGNSQQARQEIEVLKKRAGQKNQYSVDKLLANFFMQEGYISEAVTVLLGHYEAKKTSLVLEVARSGHSQSGGIKPPSAPTTKPIS